MILVGTLEQYQVPEYESIIKYVTVAHRFKNIGKQARKQTRKQTRKQKRR